MPERDLFASPAPTPLNEEQEAWKRRMYEAMPVRRRRFVDRIGYEAWDPFQKPKDPLDIRRDATQRTTQQLVRLFLQEKGREQGNSPGNAYSQGVLDCALGIVNKDEKYRGIYEFCLWYRTLLSREEESDHESPL
jgi:hypothetical protein